MTIHTADPTRPRSSAPSTPIQALVVPVSATSTSQPRSDRRRTMQITPMSPTPPMYQVAYGARRAAGSRARLASTGITAPAASAIAANGIGMRSRRPAPAITVSAITARKSRTEATSSHGSRGGIVHHSPRKAR